MEMTSRTGKGRIVIRPYGVAVKRSRKLPSDAGEGFEIVTQVRGFSPNADHKRAIASDLASASTRQTWSLEIQVWGRSTWIPERFRSVQNAG